MSKARHLKLIFISVFLTVVVLSVELTVPISKINRPCAGIGECGVVERHYGWPQMIRADLVSPPLVIPSDLSVSLLLVDALIILVPVSLVVYGIPLINRRRNARATL